MAITAAFDAVAAMQAGLQRELDEKGDRADLSRRVGREPRALRGPG
jgi:hypothetical protein